MAKAHKLPSGSWRVQTFRKDANGEAHRKSFTGPDKREVEYQAKLWEHETEHAPPRQLTFGEAWDRYIASRSNVISPSTHREYLRSRHHDLQGLIALPIDDLTQEQIQTEINREAATHSPKTVRNMHGSLVAVLKMFRPDCHVTTRLPQYVKPDLYTPNDNDVEAIIRATQGTELFKAILLSAFGSLRRSEIAKLPADRMQGQLLYVLKAMVEGPEHIWIIKDPKTKAGKRVVEFSAEIAAHFTSTNGYLCDLEPNQITRQFERLLKRLDIPHFRFHDLRHYQASILHALGVPDQYIMERGGWETEEVMKRVYRDALPNMTTAAAQIGNAHFTRILGNATGQDEKST